VKTKEIVLIVISAVVEAVLPFLLTQVFSLGTGKIVFILVLNTLVLVTLYLWFIYKYHKMHKNLDLLGIENCTEKLTGTIFTPETCMQNIRKTLSFMGVAGSKWVSDPPVYAEFERMLRKVSAAQGEVRFLLINPKAASWQQLNGLRRGNLSDVSYGNFIKLSKTYPCLHVRLYDTLPSFRLQFVDGLYVAVSRYKFEFSEYKDTHYGWDAPHLIVKNEEQELAKGKTRHFWSLYMAFHFLYEYIWEHSKDLSTLEL
jgi:Ca2+/Na+ antiporter